MNKPFEDLKQEIKKLANPKKAKILQRFFKTGKGEYGEGDIFLGIVVPKQRQLVKKYWSDIALNDLNKLIKSKIHEERLIALLILVEKFNHYSMSFSGERSKTRGSKLNSRPPLGHELEAEWRGNGNKLRLIYNFYLSHTKYINNWDLVDLSAPNIIGSYLNHKNRSNLYELAKSKNLWERRIAVLATFYLIKQGDCKDILKIAKILLNDKHDLIHKATGWMLREMGKRCGANILIKFLDDNYKQMPRIMLRYAIERLPKKQQQYYLHK